MSKTYTKYTKEDYTQFAETIKRMNKNDIEMDKIRHRYMEMYRLPKGTGIFFSNNGDGILIQKMI